MNRIEESACDPFAGESDAMTVCFADTEKIMKTMSHIRSLLEEAEELGLPLTKEEKRLLSTVNHLHNKVAQASR